MNKYFEKHLKKCVCVYFSAVKQLIATNRIQNKSFCLQNMCILCIFIMYI